MSHTLFVKHLKPAHIALPVLLCSTFLAVSGFDARADEPKQEKTGKRSSEVKTMKFVRQDVGAYVLEVPEGWKIGEETPWGQREIMSADALATLNEKNLEKAIEKTKGEKTKGEKTKGEKTKGASVAKSGAAQEGTGSASSKTETSTPDTPSARLQTYLNQMTVVSKFTSMSTMTAPGAHNEPWEQLYNTSLFFIMQQYRKDEVKAMPFKVNRSQQGYEACSWTIEQKDGGVRARHVVLRNSAGKILALSIKFPTTKGNEAENAAFEHMVATATLK